MKENITDKVKPEVGDVFTVRPGAGESLHQVVEFYVYGKQRMAKMQRVGREGEKHDPSFDMSIASDGRLECPSAWYYVGPGLKIGQVRRDVPDVDAHGRVKFGVPSSEGPWLIREIGVKTVLASYFGSDPSKRGRRLHHTHAAFLRAESWGEATLPPMVPKTSKAIEPHHETSTRPQEEYEKAVREEAKNPPEDMSETEWTGRLINAVNPDPMTRPPTARFVRHAAILLREHYAKTLPRWREDASTKVTHLTATVVTLEVSERMRGK